MLSGIDFLETLHDLKASFVGVEYVGQKVSGGKPYGVILESL
jgi:hypothetical protein